jgi:5'-nucleotidase / UDP-sugar diphosphatase
MHSRIEQISGSDATCSPDGAADGSCYGGAARLATAIRDRRAALEAEGRPVLTLDAGDQSQGTLFYTTYRGKAEIEMMNLIGFDAMTLGNHEFNNGPDSLAEMLAEADFPIVAGNVRIAEGAALAEHVKDHLILDLGGERVGILGVTTPDTVFLSSPGPDVSFEDPAAHLAEAVERLRSEGVNRIIVLSHLGFLPDQRLAAEVDGISLIIGGHSHTLLSNTEEDTPDYATMVESPSGRAVPIVQAYAFSRYLGDLALAFDEDGAVVSAEGDTVLLDASFAEAEDVLERVAALAGPIEQLKTTEVAELAAPIDGSRESCRAMECEMGNTVTNAMLARIGNPDVTIALTNGGGLRASLEAGTATVGDVLTVLPFQNTLFTLRVPGSALVAALEHGVNDIEEGAGRFPQVAGLRFRLDPSVEPNGGRVSEVEVRTADGWEPIDEGASYGHRHQQLHGPRRRRLRDAGRGGRGALRHRHRHGRRAGRIPRRQRPLHPRDRRPHPAIAPLRRRPATRFHFRTDRAGLQWSAARSGRPEPRRRARGVGQSERW